MRMRHAGILASLILSFGVFSTAAEDPEVAKLITQLGSEKIEEKTTAARQLGELGPAAAGSVSSLIKSLEIDQPGLKYEVIVALGRISSNTKDTVPALQRVSADPSPILRHSAIDALRSFGPDAKSSIPQLKKLLKDKEPLISASAARAITEIDAAKGAEANEVIAILLAGLKDEHPEVSIEAVQGLALIGTPAVSAIQALIADSSSPASLNACDALAAIGPRASAAVDHLAVAAKSQHLPLRWHAISALGDIGPAAKPAIGTLIAALDDPDPQVRFSAGQSLVKIGKASIPALVQGLKNEKSQQIILPILSEFGPDAAEAVSTLTGLMNAKDLETQREAILGLAAIGPAAKSATPILIKRLEDKKAAFRPATAYALGKLTAKEAVSTLRASLNEPHNPLLRLASVWALLQIDPANNEYATIALPELTAALENEVPQIRREAALALGQMGAKAKSAVAALQLHLNDVDPSVRRETLVAFAEIGPDSQSAVTEITQMLNEGDITLRPIACYALGRIGAASAPAVPRLQQLLQSRESHQKTMAAWALVHIAPDAETAKAATPYLVSALQGAIDPNIRVEVAKTLGLIGSKSPATKQALESAIKDSDESVRKAAQAALSSWK